MKKKFKVEPIFDGTTVWYAFYQKRFLFGWKYLGRSPFKEDAKRIVGELTEPPTYFETK